jgi:3-oxoadipate enol-lactonase
MADYAEDAAGLLDVLGWQRCRVIGVSFGGMVAQEFAVRHPERVERMVLACTSSGGRGGASYPLHELADLPEDERLERNFELADTRMDADWRATNPDAFERMAKFYRARNEIGSDDPNRDRGQRWQLEARAGLDVFDRLPTLRMPVYLCGGRYDGIAPPANMQAIAGQLPNATLEFFEGGHLFLLQDRTAYPKIVSFLAA